MSLNNQALNLDARQILLKRGNAIVSQGYIGPIGEVTLDTTYKTLRIHDGVTPGGIFIPTSANLIAEVSTAVGAIGGTTISGQISTALIPVYANIAAVSANVSALLGNPPATLNTLAEIAAAVDNDPDFSAKILLAINQVRSNIAGEVTRAVNAEQELQSSINVENAARLAANVILVNLINNQATIRAAADTVLQTSITNLDNSLAPVAKSGAYSSLTGTPDFNAFVGNIVPNTDNNQYLGSVNRRWHSLYVGPGSINIDGATIGVTGGRIVTNTPIDLGNSNIEWANVINRPTALSQFSNDTNFANVTYVNTQISNLINGAPGALDTLNEIAVAFQNADSNLISTINSLAASSAANLAVETSARNAADTTLQNNINSEASARIAADTALQANITAESSARSSADTTLQNNITAEETARIAADAALQANITAEATARIAADAALQANITAEATALQTNITAEATARIAADAALQANITAESNARAALQSNLQSQINSILSNIDPTALDSLTEIVASFQSSDGNLLTTINNISTSANAAIAAESAARAVDVAALQSNISAEASARSALQSNLQSQINSILSNIDPAALDSLTEIVASFQSSDGNLLTTINNLSIASNAAIAAETTARIQAVSDEANARVLADTNLQSNITAEVNARTQAVSDEANARVLADTNLQSNITAETNARIQAVSDEANARVASDTSLQSNITAETNARILADSNLQNIINSITSNLTAKTGNISFVDTTMSSPEGSDIFVQAQNIKLVANDGVISRTWSFEADGGVRTPGGLLTIGGYTILTDNNNELDLGNGNDITIRSNVGGVAIGTDWDGVQNTWGFKTDGNLELPNGTRIRDIGNAISNTSGLELGNHGFTLDFGSPTNDWAIMSGARLIEVRPDETFNINFPEQANWQFANTGNITFPDDTIQSTAWTGSAPTVDVTNTNGLTTTYYPTFVEARTNGQYVRADVDLTYRTDNNLLKSGNLQVGQNIYGSYLGGISNAIQFRPNIDIDKRFLFTVDSIGGTYLRSGMEMPIAEVNKASTLGFPHNNGHSGYIYSQGSDDNGTEFNNAFNIMSNGVDLKLSAFNSDDKYVWTFDVKGNLTLPQTNMNSSPAPVSFPGITYTDGTRQTTAWTGSAPTVDVTNTNGLTTTFYPTFVESRTNGQYIRADVDLTYRTDTNTLTTSNVKINNTLKFSNNTEQTTAWLGSTDRIESGSAEVVVANTGTVSLPAVANSQVTISGATKTVKGNPYSVRSAFSNEYEIWKASSEDVVAAKVTVRLHNDYYTYTELFEVMLVKEATNNANVSYSVGPRLKSNDSYPDGTVDVRLSDGNKLTLYYTSVQGDATFYTFDAVEFTKTV